MSEVDGTIHWTELMTSDVEAAKSYYGDICGWEFETNNMPSGEAYTIARIRGEMAVGIMSLSDIPGGEHIPPHWLSYLAVKDVDDAVARTRAAGGTINRDCFDIPDVGRIAIVTDPTGAVIGLMTPIN